MWTLQDRIMTFPNVKHRELKMVIKNFRKKIRSVQEISLIK